MKPLVGPFERGAQGGCLALACALAALAVPARLSAQPPPTGVPPPVTVSRLADPQSPAGLVAPARLPGQQPAVGQVPLQPLPVSRLEDEPRAARLDAGRTFSLRISEPQPVQDLLLLLVRDTRFSIVAAPGVAGTFVGELKEVTLEQALDLVLHPLELDYSVERSFIRVFPRRMETRLFDVNYLQTARAARRALGAAPGGGDPRVWLVESSETADYFEELTTGIRTLLSAGGRFNLDRKAALLQVTDYADRLDRVGLYVEAAGERVTRQVEIRALVVEVALDAEHDAGVDWGAVLAALGRDPAGASGGRVPGLDLADPSLVVSALAAQGVVRVLARPRVVAMNNEPAYMRVGRESASAATGPADAAGGAAEGLVLMVTPQIAADGIIQMSVSPSVTERTGQTTSAEEDAVPVVSVREADTLVRVRSGETAVISGLLQGDVGRKTDLVVLLMPTLVVPAPASTAGR